MIANRPVVVLSAGLAGLTAAHFLKAKGIPVLVFEAGKQIAGLASTFQENGFIYDFGAHFITNRLARAVGIGDQCRNVSYYGESFYLNGKTYRYPLGLVANPRFLLGGLAAKLAHQNGPPESLHQHFQNLYGQALAADVAIPLVEAWSGTPATELASSVADKLPLGLGRLIFLTVMSRLSGRAIAIGYCKEKPESTNVWHVYPEGGTSQLCHALAQPLHDCIRLHSQVESILVEDGRAVAVQVNGRTQEAAAVISSAPCNVLPALLKGTSKLSFLSRFRFRPMVFVLLRLLGRKLLKDSVVWLPERKFPFFRLTEAPVSMPWLAPAGKTMITVDLGCQRGDEIWNASDDNLAHLCLENLTPLIPDVKTRYLGVRVLRTPYAYPVFLRNYEDDRLAFQQSTGIESLYSIGRNGEFDHLLTEDVYWRTLARMNQVLTSLAGNNLKGAAAAV
jgi:protoporphyrinogen oxidase